MHSKRIREEYKYEDPIRECKVTKDCSVICQANNSQWFIESDERLPIEIRNKYTKCREKQIRDFNNALEIESDSEDEEYNESTSLHTKQYQLRNMECKDNNDLLELIPNPSELREWISHLTHIKDIRFARKLGSGRNGLVFEICNPDISSSVIVVKFDISPEKFGFETEFEMQSDFYAFGLAPKPMGILHDIFVMGKIDGTLGQLLKTKMSFDMLDQIIFGITDLLFRMCDANLMHRDMHWDNIAYIVDIETKKIHYLLIDFGSARFGCDPQLELAQMIRTSFLNSRDVTNMSYIREHLIKMFKTNYPNEYIREDLSFWNVYYIALLRNTPVPTSINYADTVVLETTVPY
jgi:hypothetical protein